ncbi:MAG: hypothetical protein HQL69_18930 [Magnetococcales bacterium]|nr:hypothetical protein [Magnetococcales bacterium]
MKIKDAPITDRSEQVAVSEIQHGCLFLGVSEWFVPTDVYGMYGFPLDRSNFNKMVKRKNWRNPELQNKIWRRRIGRGGGYEYHFTLIPIIGRVKWLKEKIDAKTIQENIRATPEIQHLEAWTFYANQSEKCKKAAKKRLSAIMALEALVCTVGGQDVGFANSLIAKNYKVSKSSLYNWQARLHGKPREDRLAYLVDQYTRRNSY